MKRVFEIVKLEKEFNVKAIKQLRSNVELPVAIEEALDQYVEIEEYVLRDSKDEFIVQKVGPGFYLTFISESNESHSYMHENVMYERTMLFGVNVFGDITTVVSTNLI